MGARWTADQVRGAAPDPRSVDAARKLATPRPWSRTGCDDETVWGSCQGSGSKPYQVMVDLTAPAYRCSCPSRKFPCKHALGLLLLWSEGGVPAAARAEAVEEWVASRRAGAGKARAARGGVPADPEAARRRAEQRAARVACGLADLERWLLDQIRDGLAGAARAGYAHWDRMAARLVDAQAPGAAGMVRRMAGIPASGPDWPDRLLEQYALAWLLARGYRRIDGLPAGVAATLRARVGFTTPREELLRVATPVRDQWFVLGARDDVDDQLTVRRVWLRGRETGRRALVLSFAPPGQPLDTSLAVGTVVDAELAFYPGALELRAVVATTHHVERAGEPDGEPIEDFLSQYARGLASDPWLDAWPVVLGSVVPLREQGWHLVDTEGRALPMVAGEFWRLLAVSGGRPVVVGGEWTRSGLRPLTVWADGRMVRS